MKVIGYVRVSTEEQAREGVSLAAQERRLRAYAELYELEVLEVCSDAGVSAKTLERPGLERALRALEEGLAGGLLIAKLDRLTRSVADWNDLIDRFFGRKAALFSVGEQIDTRTAGGRLVLNVLVSVAQWEREAIGERTAAALRHLKDQGVKLGAPRLEDPDTIARIRELLEKDVSLRGIARTLEQESFPTLRGGRWRAATVSKIARREGLIA